ncbi:MAG TPA: ubiquitin-like small modifier protein 1 [Chloroflexota bacterium]|nr:ubiquitin-like small modifier protein 1 [Chloroflexota bacterium]
MTVTVRIPTPLRKITGGAARVNADGDTVRAALDSLVTTYPELRDRVYDEDAKVRRFINLFVGEEDIRFLDGLDTPLSEGAELSLVPAVAGGSGQ